MKIERRFTKLIQVGKVPIGGYSPISIQTMLSTHTADIKSTLAQIQRVHAAGCEIVRFSVTNEDDAKAIATIKKASPLPLIADIHFDHRLALLSLENGIDCLRINPGNIGSDAKVMEVVAAARERKIPIRIGVNSGSLPSDLIARYGVSEEAMVEAALRHIAILERLGYYEIKVSVKASDLNLMLQSYRLLSSRTPFALHLGVTEAGLEPAGTVKSSLGIGTLLSEGIGDTIRVSLTAEPEREVMVAREILKSLGLRKGLNIIACPTCGRTRIDLISLAAKVQEALADLRDHDLTVAVMGCAVNGPGEAREADFGIAGGKGEGLLFVKGKIVAKVPEADLVKELERLIRSGQNEATLPGSIGIP